MAYTLGPRVIRPPTTPSPTPTGVLRPDSPATPTTPTPTSAPYTAYGRSFTGYGDANPQAGTAYTFLPTNLRSQINTDQRGRYALLANEATPTITVSELLASKQRGTNQYEIRPQRSRTVGRDRDEEVTAALYGTKEEFLEQLGLSGVPENTRISMVNAASMEGDVQGNYRAITDTAHARADGLNRAPIAAPVFGHQAISDPKYKGYVQIGDIGPLEDDIKKMLGKVYERSGVQNNPQAQEAIKNALFQYDPRFGVLANSDFIAAAAEKNNNRAQGFWEKPIGKAIIQFAISSIPGVGVVAGPVYAGATQLRDGASWGQAIRSAAATYAGGQVSGFVNAPVAGYVTDATGSQLAGSVAGSATGSAAGNATSQLIGTGTINPTGVLAAGVTGGVTAGVTDTLTGAGVSPNLSTAAGRVGGKIAGNFVLGRKVNPLDLGLTFVNGAWGPGSRGNT